MFINNYDTMQCVILWLADLRSANRNILSAARVVFMQYKHFMSALLFCHLFLQAIGATCPYVFNDDYIFIFKIIIVHLCLQNVMQLRIYTVFVHVLSRHT